MTTSVASTTPLLAVEDLSMVFPGGQRALDRVALEIRPGEVHGLIGQNGSGKSTVIKILAGYHVPEPGGRLRLRGEPVTLPLAPGQFRALGVSFVHQTLGLVDTLTVLDNVRVGRFRRGRFGQIDWRQERAELRTALARFGLSVDPDALVASLPQSTHAVIALARAIDELREVEGPGLLVLDEPTPYLPKASVDVLFGAVREIAATGAGILFVSHRLDEVLEITDRLTVLRDGRVAATAVTSDLDEERLVEAIIGRRLESYYPSAPAVPARERLGAIEELSGSVVDGFSTDLYSGEIIGVTSLVGDGFEQVPYLLAGAEPARSGRLTMDGATVELPHASVRDTVEAGVALVPGNRARDGGVMDLSLIENVTLPRVSAYFRRLLIDARRERTDVELLLQQFDVRPPDPDRLLGTLSGGNQQKAVLAKWLATGPRLLVLHEPTQGIDVGSRSQIFERLRASAREGRCVLIASLEHADLAGICDRVFVLRRGRAIAELHGEDLNEERIASLCLSGG